MYCFCSVGFDSQDPLGSSELLVTPAPGNSHPLAVLMGLHSSTFPHTVINAFTWVLWQAVQPQLWVLWTQPVHSHHFHTTYTDSSLRTKSSRIQRSFEKIKKGSSSFPGGNFVEMETRNLYKHTHAPII